MQITQPLNKRLHALLTQVNMMEQKMDLIRHYSSNRTSSSKELTVSEALEIIKHLESFKPKAIVITVQSPEFDASNKMRRKIISLFREMGFEYTDIMLYKKVADMKRIHAYILSTGYLKKHLNKYAHNELVKLVTQIENIHVKHLKEARKNG
jgi:hypothetical protein